MFFRYHNKSLLVTFDSDNEPGTHAEALTREIQQSFKRLDADIRGMDKGPTGPQDDPAVRKQVQQQLAQVRMVAVLNGMHNASHN